jgi:23S rRNA (uracil1939-C5)-methyltransferase
MEGQRERRERGGEVLEVEVLRWAHGGDAVCVPGAGALEGRVVFVEDAVPGDRLRVEVVEARERWGRAMVREVVSPSASRRVAPCGIQDRCGGCPWMIGTAEAQRASREAILKGEVRKRLGGRADETVIRLAESPGELGYRHRLVLAFSRVGRDVVLGFHARKTHTIVPLPEAGCAIATPTLNAHLDAVRAALSADTEDGAVGRVTLLAGHCDGRETYAGWVEVDGGEAFGIGAEAVAVDFGGYLQTLEPRAFAQANAAVTGQILHAIEGFARASRGDGDPWAVELFAGAGTLTMALWRAGWRVVGYEGDGAARAGFEATRTRAGVNPERGAWHVADLAAGLPWPMPAATPGLVLLDPPRAGASALMPWLRGLGARHVAYLSCDLATGLRDMRELIGSESEPGPYDLLEVTGFDMFPHSGHQEILGLLRRR